MEAPGCPRTNGSLQGLLSMGSCASVVCVQRLSVRAVLDDSPEALKHAKEWAAEGDESWEQWVVEYQRGDALILRLEFTLELGGGDEDVVSASLEGFFVENHLHAPKLEQQIAELAAGDLGALADELAKRGHPIDMQELSSMYVHVELDPAVRRRLLGNAAPLDARRLAGG
jgi:hypothetical protein